MLRNLGPLKNLTVNAEYSYLATATKLDGVDMTLGHEIELSGKYVFSKDISLSAGYSFMTGTETMNILKRADNGGKLRWGWVSLNVSPTIFTSKW